jgi:hypothetical protein
MKTLKTVTIRGSITFKASEDRHQELLKSFRRAVKMCAAVKGVSLVSGTPES